MSRFSHKPSVFASGLCTGLYIMFPVVLPTCMQQVVFLPVAEIKHTVQCLFLVDFNIQVCNFPTWYKPVCISWYSSTRESDVAVHCWRVCQSLIYISQASSLEGCQNNQWFICSTLKYEATYENDRSVNRWANTFKWVIVPSTLKGRRLG